VSKRAYKITWLALLVLSLWACFFIPAYASGAAAVSAEWTLQDARAVRERVLLRLNGTDAGAPSSIVRNGPQSVEMIWPELLDKLPGGLMVAPPPEALLFNGIVPGERGLILLLKDPAFGFVVTRPQSGLIQIDIFKNPLGARWVPPAQVGQPAQSGQTGQSGQPTPPGPAQAPAQNQPPQPAPAPNPPVAPASLPASALTDPGSKSAAQAPVSPQPPAPAQTPAQVLTSPQQDRNGQGSQAAQPVEPPAQPLPRGQYLAPPAADANINPAPAESLTPDFPTLPAGVLNPVMAAQPNISDQADPADGVPDMPNGAGALPPDGAQNNAPGIAQPAPQPNPQNAVVPVAQSATVSDPAAQSVDAPDAAVQPAALDAAPGTPSDAAAVPAPGAMTQEGARQLLDNPPVYPVLTPEQPADAAGAAPGTATGAAPGMAPGNAPQDAFIGEGEEAVEQFLEWPPMDMPETLPPAPLPPLYNPAPGAPSGSAGRPTSDATFIQNFFRIFEARPAYAAETAEGQAEATTVAGQIEAVPNQADAGAPIEYEAIDAPFIYRSRLVKDGPKPDPAEARIPVMINVPAASVTDAERGAQAQQPAQIPAQPVDQAQQPAATPVQPTAIPQQTVTTPEQSGDQAAPDVPAQQPGITPTPPAQPAQSAQPVVQPQQPAQIPVQPAPQPQQPVITPAQPDAAGPSDAQPVEQAQPVPVQLPAEPGVTQPVIPPAGQPATPPAEPTTTPPAAQPAAQTTGAGVAPVDPGKPVIYVDEQGNPVDPPLEPQQAIVDLERNMSTGEFAVAYDIADRLSRQNNLDRRQREYVLHRRADAIFSLHREDPAAFFNEIMDSTTIAINFNTRSPRNSEAYLRLGFLQLKANNAYEAEAYFSILRHQYPRDEAVPLSYYYMGDYQYTQGNLNDAVLQFVQVVQEYPDSRYARDAALGLTRTLYRLGYYDKAYEVIDYVEKRWPRYYLDYPPVLSVLGDTSYRARQIDRARQAYLLYYNLLPDAPDANIILSRIGDIYLSQKYRDAATFVYEEAVRRFPGTEGGVIAMMRLAENGINDDPTMAGMFRVFQQPYNLGPAEAYRKIIREYPDSPLVPLVKLKLAMWNVWQKDFEAAFQLCNEIVMADPNHPLAAKAIEVSRNAFAMLAAESVNSKRYERVRDAWNRYPLLHTQEELLDPDSRLALAVSQWEGGDPDGALRTIEPFFLGTKLPEYSEMALTLGLTILVEYDRWQAVEDLADRVSLWEITPPTKRQMDYALGLAYENQGKGQEAMPIWKGLYEQNALPPEQQAYADYFLARQAESDNDLESAYRIGQDALQRLKDLAALNPEQADTEKIKNLVGSLMNIAQTSGLLQNALDYGKEYLTYASPGSDDYLSIMYNMAALQRQRGSMGEWEKILTSLSTDYPGTYYGKAASSQLSAYRMGRDASQYAPAGGF
jgi:TolA-binding protein